ncbi:MAG: hypothetical protein EU550_00405 [Promethearchaeota archaeon]|nr:MAG: hypothetical protein EU550_00405 [Candidatus Lokiarchaeota archaeon]
MLEDVWILSEGGTTIFSRVYNPKVNEQLFGALMSAINQFAEQVAEGGISSFELSNKKFSIIRKDNFLFVANASVKQKDKRVKDELKKISEKFFEEYSHILEDWDNDVSVFEDFEKKIEDSLDQTLKKFQNAFW